MLIDAHAHLDRYESELDAALQEIRQHGILTVCVSMDIASYERNLEVSKRCELVLPTFGVHPWNAPQYVARLEDLRGAIEASPMLGEIGLDYRFVQDAAQYPAQRQVFEFFLAAASRQDKIVNLHASGAEEDVLRLLDRYGVRRAIVHWYAGPLDVLHELAGRGVCFSVGVEALHSEHIRAIAREVPLEQLLTETDNPGGLKWLIGKLGMPVAIKEVIQTLAELRETTTEAMVQTVQENWLRLIRDDARLQCCLPKS